MRKHQLRDNDLYLSDVPGLLLDQENLNPLQDQLPVLVDLP